MRINLLKMSFGLIIQKILLKTISINFITLATLIILIGLMIISMSIFINISIISATAFTTIATVPTPTPVQFLKTSSIPIIYWNTYLNTKYNYSIKYPQNWHFREDNPHTPGIAIKHTLQHTDFSPVPNYDDYQSKAFFISVILWDNPAQLCIQDWLRNENINHPALTLGKPTIVDDKEAIRYEPEGNAYCIEVWFTHNNKTYQLFYCEPSKKKEYIAIFEQMLSTFKVQTARD